MAESTPTAEAVTLPVSGLPPSAPSLPSLDVESASEKASTMPEQRDQWPSRLSFVLAAMGGAVGIGNLLRYPSIVARHYGLQWFIPYTIALLIVGIPILALEICLGQAMRGGAVIAFGAVNKRLRALGFTSTYMSITTATYYVVIMAWVMTFFRFSFMRPLPWIGNNNFFEEFVVRNPDPVPGSFFFKYPNLGMVWETLAWTVVTWILVYFSIFKGVSVTGKVVYVTMLLPMILCGILLIRAVTLPGAGKGIMMYIGSFSMQKLMDGGIWKDAIVQIFFSIGIGFGTFIAYSSYNSVHANAVQDAVIVSSCNSAFEVLMGFAAFAIIGVMKIDLDSGKRISSFEIGFTTFPQALGVLPGANIWAALFFLTIYLLAIDSAFALTESFAAVVLDTDWGKKMKKPYLMGLICFLAMLCSTVYSTKYGYYFLDGVDMWLNSITLIFAAWAQVVAVTSIYRYKDVVSQTGFPAYALAQASYVTSQVLFVILAFTVSMGAGIAVMLPILILGTGTAAAIAKSPEVKGPRLGTSKFTSALWWLTAYPGHMLMTDLNMVIASGNRWSLPVFWAPTLRWVTAPVLMYVLGIGYNDFFKKPQRDPLQLFGFILSHLGVAIIIVGYAWPKTFAMWLPEKELETDKRQYVPGPGNALMPNSPYEGESPRSARSGSVAPFDEYRESMPSTPKAVHMA